MLFQLNAINEVQFILYLVVAILSIQISFYYFFQYYKIRDAKLQVYKILLSFGSFLLFSIIGSFVLITVNIFIFNFVLKEFFFKFGYILLLLSPISFLFFVSSKDFPTIDLKVSKVLMAISMIPIVISLFVSTTQSPFFLYSLLITMIVVIYIFIFQIRLISTSVGNIRKRLILMLIGWIINVISVALIAIVPIEPYAATFGDSLLFADLTLLITSLIILFISSFNFPSYLEFKWSENLDSLHIINTKNKSCIYNSDFSDISERAIDQFKVIDDSKQEKIEKVFSGGLIGIDHVISVITDTQDEKINKIKQGDLLIIIEQGKLFPLITYALVVKKDIKSNKYFINSLINQFENFYNELLSNLDELTENQEQLFGSFDIIIKNIIK